MNQRPRDKVRFAEYGLVLVPTPPEQLSVGQGGAKIRDRTMLGRIEKTIAPEEPAEPPTLAATGAVRWMKRKVVVMNGAGRSV